VPHIFLTYMTQIPSRQTYLANAGLAMIVGVPSPPPSSSHWRTIPAHASGCIVSLPPIDADGAVWLGAGRPAPWNSAITHCALMSASQDVNRL
jgi:hypothetical protein